MAKSTSLLFGGDNILVSSSMESSGIQDTCSADDAFCKPRDLRVSSSSSGSSARKRDMDSTCNRDLRRGGIRGCSKISRFRRGSYNESDGYIKEDGIELTSAFPRDPIERMASPRLLLMTLVVPEPISVLISCNFSSNFSWRLASGESNAGDICGSISNIEIKTREQMECKEGERL